jgi:predicted transcriptional regulator
MRISEVESSIEFEKKGAFVTLLNMLKTKDDAKKSGLKIPLASLEKLMNNLGHSISYEEIDKLVKSSDSIANLIGDYNQDFVTVNTASTIDQELDTEKPGNLDTVKSMAKRATNRRE